MPPCCTRRPAATLQGGLDLAQLEVPGSPLKPPPSQMPEPGRLSGGGGSWGLCHEGSMGSPITKDTMSRQSPTSPQQGAMARQSWGLAVPPSELIRGAQCTPAAPREGLSTPQSPPAPLPGDQLQRLPTWPGGRPGVDPPGSRPTAGPHPLELTCTGADPGSAGRMDPVSQHPPGGPCAAPHPLPTRDTAPWRLPQLQLKN